MRIQMIEQKVWTFSPGKLERAGLKGYLAGAI